MRVKSPADYREKQRRRQGHTVKRATLTAENKFVIRKRVVNSPPEISAWAAMLGRYENDE